MAPQCENPEQALGRGPDRPAHPCNGDDGRTLQPGVTHSQSGAPTGAGAAATHAAAGCIGIACRPPKQASCLECRLSRRQQRHEPLRRPPFPFAAPDFDAPERGGRSRPDQPASRAPPVLYESLLCRSVPLFTHGRAATPLLTREAPLGAHCRREWVDSFHPGSRAGLMVARHAIIIDEQTTAVRPPEQWILNGARRRVIRTDGPSLATKVAGAKLRSIIDTKRGVGWVVAFGAGCLASVGCGADDSAATSAGSSPLLPNNGAEVALDYAAIVSASYEDSLAAAQALDTALQQLVESPSAATHEAAKQAWLASREPYLQTEVYRFYDGPIDEPENGPEGRLNAWPLDEFHIDYVAGEQGASAGIVNNPKVTINGETLSQMNENPGEKDIALGYHAIEFLLWGQDTDPEGPGDRPYTDYVVGPEGTAANQDRRGQYLLTVSDLLMSDLQYLTEAWAPGGGNYRAEFESLEPAEALGRILSGMIILTGFETGQERLEAALLDRNQEEEHSCFSDNTHRDMIQDVRGIQNVWVGSYTRTDGSAVQGLGIRDLVAQTDADLARRVSDAMATSMAAAEALDGRRFDQEILADNPEGNARVNGLIDALFEQRTLLEEVFRLYELSRIPDPE